jgi:hypothetical protein
MCDHWFRSRGLFVGTGVVEVGCKSVIGQMLKQSGMRWTVNDTDSIITVRCAQARPGWRRRCRRLRCFVREGVRGAALVVGRPI